jgi:hypothetical protein
LTYSGKYYYSAINPINIFIAVMSVFFVFGSSYAQKNYDTLKLHKKLLFISAGMGISLVNTPAFNDFLKDEIPYSNTDSIKNFSVGVEVFGGLELQFNKRFSLKLDYSYFFKTLSYNYGGFITYDYFYLIHQPYLMAYYNIPGKHYRFSFGGGAGYLYSIFHRTDQGGIDIKYTSTGFGIKGEAIFSAELSNKLYSYLSGFLIGESFGILKDSNGTLLVSPLTGKEVNLSTFGLGLRLGFSYNIN